MANRDASPATSATRVRRTGIALVHEGEIILPARGSEATTETADGDIDATHFYFPVEVIVVGSPPAIDTEAIIDKTLERLAQCLDGLA